MKLLALALADENQRCTKGYPAKGSYLALHLHPDVQKLAALVGPGDELRVLDMRVEPLALTGEEDLILCHIDFFQERMGREVAAAARDRVVFFGRRATLWGQNPPEWVRSHVIGDIAGVWDEIRADAARFPSPARPDGLDISHSSLPVPALKPFYRAEPLARHVVPDRGLDPHSELNTSYQAMDFARGCACPAPLKPFCTESLYCGEAIMRRTPDEIVGEVISLPGKLIHLQDEDVARWPDYYAEVFGELWNYRRQWVVNASDRLFEYPRFIRLLAKAGTRVVMLNETFLSLGLFGSPGAATDRLGRALVDERYRHALYRRVKSIQAAKMLAGARVAIVFEEDRPPDYPRISAVLRQLDLDYIEPRFFRRRTDGTLEFLRTPYRPMLQPTNPAWVKDQFYSLSAILDRVARRPRRVGFYTTVMHLLPRSLAARQDFYEGIPPL